jgi:hypothetical protein
MTDVRIWLSAHHHKSFAGGGWAWVRTQGGEISGAAGGDRRTTRPAMALAGLASALKSIPAETPLLIHAAPLDARVIAELLTGRPARLLAVEPDPKTPLAFAAAWAETAEGKARMTGAFEVAIPRPNLAKVAGLS